MRRLTETTRARLDRLRNSWIPQGSRLTPHDEIAEINEIGNAREPGAIPGLVGLLYSPREPVTRAAALAIEYIISGCNPVDLAQLDDLMRELSEWHSPQVKLNDIRILSYSLTSVLGVFSFNANGYVREAAIRELANIEDGSELPFLLIRLNDWVEKVRNTSKYSVFQRIRPDYATHFVRWLPLLYRLEGKSRGDHREVREAVLKLLRTKECFKALRDGLKSPDRLTRRAAFRILIETSGDDCLDVLRDVFAARDSSMKLAAACELRKRLDGQPLRELLERLKVDKLMPVRKEALYGFLEKFPDLAPTNLRFWLVDPHISMREAARFYLRQYGKTDFLRFYADTLDTAIGGQRAAAIAGLGETGGKQDASLLSRFLSDPNPRVRRSAVRALDRLDAERFAPQILLALRDNSASVAKAAGEAMQTHPGLISPEEVRAIYETVDVPHTRRILISIAARMTWWDSALILIMATESPDQKIRDLSTGHLRAWQGNARRLYGRPTKERIEAIEKAIAQHGAMLEPATRNDLIEVVAIAKRSLP